MRPTAPWPAAAASDFEPNVGQQLSAVAEGRLVKQWTVGGRSYVRLHVDGPRGVAWMKVYSPELPHRAGVIGGQPPAG